MGGGSVFIYLCGPASSLGWPIYQHNRLPRHIHASAGASLQFCNRVVSSRRGEDRESNPSPPRVSFLVNRAAAAMTTAARPTWAPAKGGNEQGGTRIFGPSQKYSSRDLAAHTTLKPRYSFPLFNPSTSIRFDF